MSKLKPTQKQIRAFKKSVENGGNISKAMREAGYSLSTINNPNNLTDSDGWQMLLEIYIPDEKLAKKLNEGLDSTKQMDFEKLPDMPTRHKYLETALKVKGKLRDNTSVNINEAKILVMPSQLIDKYQIKGSEPKE